MPHHVTIKILYHTEEMVKFSKFDLHVICDATFSSSCVEEVNILEC